MSDQLPTQHPERDGRAAEEPSDERDSARLETPPAPLESDPAAGSDLDDVLDATGEIIDLAASLSEDDPTLDAARLDDLTVEVDDLSDSAGAGPRVPHASSATSTPDIPVSTGDAAADAVLHEVDRTLATDPERAVRDDRSLDDVVDETFDPDRTMHEFDAVNQLERRGGAPTGVPDGAGPGATAPQESAASSADLEDDDPLDGLGELVDASTLETGVAPEVGSMDEDAGSDPHPDSTAPDTVASDDFFEDAAPVVNASEPEASDPVPAAPVPASSPQRSTVESRGDEAEVDPLEAIDPVDPATLQDAAAHTMQERPGESVAPADEDGGATDDDTERRGAGPDSGGHDDEPAETAGGGPGVGAGADVGSDAGSDTGGDSGAGDDDDFFAHAAPILEPDEVGTSTAPAAEEDAAAGARPIAALEQRGDEAEPTDSTPASTERADEPTPESAATPANAPDEPDAGPPSTDGVDAPADALDAAGGVVDPHAAGTPGGEEALDHAMAPVDAPADATEAVGAAGERSDSSPGQRDRATSSSRGITVLAEASLSLLAAPVRRLPARYRPLADALALSLLLSVLLVWALALRPTGGGAAAYGEVDAVTSPHGEPSEHDDSGHGADGH